MQIKIMHRAQERGRHSNAGATTHHTPEGFKSPYNPRTYYIVKTYHIIRTHHMPYHIITSYISGTRPYGEVSGTVTHHTAEYIIVRTITKSARDPANDIIIIFTSRVVRNQCTLHIKTFVKT